MSRIQNILEKAERDGTIMRTGRMVPFEPPVAAPPLGAGFPDPVRDSAAAAVPTSSASAVIAPAATATPAIRTRPR